MILCLKMLQQLAAFELVDRMVLTQCRGPIHSLTANSGIVGSSGFSRMHSLRTLTARADFPAAISDRASWYHKWNSSKANFMALSKH